MLRLVESDFFGRIIVMDKIYDVIVVGGQFAGLSFAKEASKLGLKILLLEKKNDLTKGFGTTGIVLDIRLGQLDFDQNLLYGPVGDLDFYFTKDVFLKINTGVSRYFMTRTEKILKKLKNDCLKNGAEIKEGHSFQKVIAIDKNITIEAEGKNGPEQFYTKFIVGADGAQSTVAKETGLGANTRFLTGLEYVIPHQKSLINNKFSILFDYEIAPGYCAWLILNNEEYVLGIAGYTGKFMSMKGLLKAKKFFEEKEKIKLNIANITPKAGIIPINGIVDKSFSKHAMLIGDAGGYCGPLFAGGIFPAIISGRFSAEIISDYLKTGKVSEDFIKERFKKSNVLFNKKERLARMIFDRINDNKELRHLGNFLKEEKAKNVLIKFLIGQPTDVPLHKLLLKLLKNLNLYDDMLKILVDLAD